MPRNLNYVLESEGTVAGTVAGTTRICDSEVS